LRAYARALVARLSKRVIDVAPPFVRDLTSAMIRSQPVAASAYRKSIFVLRAKAAMTLHDVLV